MTEYAAFKAWHEQERAEQKYKRQLKDIAQTLEALELDMLNSLIKQYAEDRAFLKALRNFTGHTPYGWETACGTDGRLIRLSRHLGWPTMVILIAGIREEVYG